MSPKRQRWEELRKILDSKKNNILAELRRSMEEQRSDTARMSFEVAQDDGDKSVDEHERHVQSTVQSMLSDQLDDIEQAMVKLDEGSYGVCEDCGQDIPVQRLAIQPFASYCVPCQEKIEQQSTRETLWNKELPSNPEEGYDYLTEEE